MRGSPVLRFILLALFLAGVAVGVRRVTAVESFVKPAPAQPSATSSREMAGIPFQLLLSAPASAVEIDSGEVMLLDFRTNPIAGTLKLDPANPHLNLIVRWQNPPTAGEHRFARLTLEPPGKDSIVHVFDAEGGLDEFLELPLPATP
ncbi:MAG: hypothetical protein V4640_06620 [Verrucomicrobiota bacterium]